MSSTFVPVLCAAGGRGGYSLLGTVDELVLVGAFIAGTYSFILPQSLGVLVELLQGTTGEDTRELEPRQPRRPYNPDATVRCDQREWDSHLRAKLMTWCSKELSSNL